LYWNGPTFVKASTADTKQATIPKTFDLRRRYPGV